MRDVAMARNPVARWLWEAFIGNPFALEFQKMLVPEVLSAKLNHPVADMHTEGALQILTDVMHTLMLLFSAFCNYLH
jgi:hypothetical protein